MPVRTRSIMAPYASGEPDHGAALVDALTKKAAIRGGHGASDSVLTEGKGRPHPAAPAHTPMLSGVTRTSTALIRSPRRRGRAIEHMRSDRFDKRSQCCCAGTDPIGARRDVELDAFARIGSA